jgi:hypothetical protein
MHDISRPKAQTGQQDQDGPIPRSNDRGLIAGSNQAFHLFRLKIAWHRSQAPMSRSGNGSIQPHGAFTFGNQKTQEHAKRRGALLGYRRPPGTSSLQSKHAQLAGVKAAGHLSEPPERIANVDAVLMERQISRAALLMHPLTEGRQQTGIVKRALGMQGNDPAISLVRQEQARTMAYSSLVRMAVM